MGSIDLDFDLAGGALRVPCNPPSRAPSAEQIVKPCSGTEFRVMHVAGSALKLDLPTSDWRSIHLRHDLFPQTVYFSLDRYRIMQCLLE